MLDTVVQQCRRLCTATRLWCYLLQGYHYQLARSVGCPTEYVEYIESHPLASDRATLAGRVGLDRRTQQVADVLSDPEYGRPDTQRIGGFRTVVGRR